MNYRITRFGIGLLAVLSLVSCTKDKNPVAPQKPPEIEITWQKCATLNEKAILSLHANAAGEIFVGTRQGGIFRTQDHGATWQSLGLPKTGILEIISAADNIFVTTAGNGIYYSKDKGQNWSDIHNPALQFPAAWPEEAVGGLAISPDGVLFAGYLNSRQLYSTKNQGANWYKVTSLLPLPTAEYFVAEGFVQNLKFDAAGNLFAATGYGLFRSTDKGANWVKLTNGLPEGWTNSVAVNSKNDLFAALSGNPAWHGAFTGGVFSLKSGQETWQEASTGLIRPIVIRDLAVDGYDFLFLAAHNGAYFSRDNGQTWTIANLGLDTPNLFCISLNSAGYLFAGTENDGLYRSKQPIYQ